MLNYLSSHFSPNCLLPHTINLQQISSKRKQSWIFIKLKTLWQKELLVIISKVVCSRCVKLRLQVGNVSMVFPTYRRFLTSLQQMTFENIVTKGAIVHNEQFPLLSPMCSTFCSIVVLSFIKSSHIFLLKCFQSRLLHICYMWERVNPDTDDLLCFCSRWPLKTKLGKWQVLIRRIKIFN